MTVRQLLNSTDSRELAEWQAYYQIEPWGERRADLRSAIIAHTVAMTSGVTKADIEDFMPRIAADKPRDLPKQSPEELKQALLKAAEIQRTNPPRG